MSTCAWENLARRVDEENARTLAAHLRVSTHLNDIIASLRHRRDVLKAQLVGLENARIELDMIERMLESLKR